MVTLLLIIAVISALFLFGSMIWLFINILQDKPEKKSIEVLLVSIASTILFMGLGLAANKKEIPTLTINDTHIKITGTNTKATLKGKTIPNISVNVKETDSYYHMNRTIKSDANGNFKMAGLRDTSKFKVTALNKNKKSKPVSITTGDIPNTAYAKLEIDNAPQDNNTYLKIKTDSTNKATIKGTSDPKAKLEFTESKGDQMTYKTVANSKGNWSITLSGSSSNHEWDYNIYVYKTGLLHNSDGIVTLINPNVAVKSETNSSTDSSTSTASSSNSKDTSSNDDPTKGTAAFKEDLDTYMGNAWPDLTYTIDSSKFITFVAPDSYMYASKSDKQNMADEIYRHVSMFSTVADFDDNPSMSIQTQSGDLLARQKVLGGMKVYDAN